MINNHLFMHNSTLNQNKFFKSIKKLLSTPKTKTENTQNRAILISSFIFIAFGLYLLSIFYADLETFNNNRKESLLGLSFLIIAASLFIYKTFFFIYTTYNYFNYKPIASVNDQNLPTCTVIIPAYNEGKQVYDTLISISKSDYPKNKLQLIAIDDGSLDNTWSWIKKAKEELKDELEIFKQPKNQGKRHALYRGFNLGKGDVFVTIDSDSIVTKDTLRNLVSPFSKDKNCAAVAGNIRVLNNKKGIIPKMLDVSFVMSFEFVRSAESNLNTVLCTPGALAAYKRDAVLACLDNWINQKFMGKPSDIGEDRALTNMILKQGKNVLFQRNAIAYTNVPEEYPGLYKMFIRWSRSNVRENLEMSKYVFTNFRKNNKLGARLLFISQFSNLLLSYPFVLFMLFFVMVHPLLFLGTTLFSILIISSFSLLFFFTRYKSLQGFWAFTYSIVYTFALFWITPYAIATARKPGWLTR